MTQLPFLSLDDLRTRGMRRECGGCTACCYVIEVKELGKGFRKQCRHVVEGHGCGIWGGPGGPGGQPVVCARYRCAWAMGFGAEEDRPDKSGVLIDFRVPSIIDLEATPALYAIGVQEGSEETPEARQAMSNVARDSGHPVNLADKMLNVLEVLS